MKALYVFCALFVVVSCYSIASSEAKELSDDDIKHQVQLEFRGLAAAIKRLDAKVYFSYFDAEKFSGLNVDGTNLTSLDSLKAIVEPGFTFVEKIESLEFPHVQITVIDGNTVVLVNEYRQQTLLKNGSRINESGGGTQVWSKSSGQWKLVSVSASVKPTKGNE
jgi:hypothetical protein